MNRHVKTLAIMLLMASTTHMVEAKKRGEKKPKVHESAGKAAPDLSTLQDEVKVEDHQKKVEKPAPKPKKPKKQTKKEKEEAAAQKAKDDEVLKKYASDFDFDDDFAEDEHILHMES
jgi:hypothetical protein